MGQSVQESTVRSTTMNPRFSLFASMVVLALLSCVQKTDSTFAITATTAAGATVLSLTAAQVTGIAALGVLVKAKALLAAALIARSRGRRSVGPSNLSLEGLESEHCYKRSFCYAATGKEEKMAPLLVLLDSCNAASSPKAVKFCEAAGLGQKFRSLEKCELRYKCSLDRDFIQDMFNQ